MEEDLETGRHYDTSSDPMLDHSLMESIRPRIFNLSFDNSRNYDLLVDGTTNSDQSDANRGEEISPEERRLSEWRSQSVSELEQLIEARINSRAALAADQSTNQNDSTRISAFESYSVDRDGERSNILQSAYNRWQTARHHLIGYRNRNNTLGARMTIQERNRLMRDSTPLFQSRIPRPSTAGPARALRDESAVRPPTPGLLDDPPEESL
jgi:hypothetical protein